MAEVHSTDLRTNSLSSQVRAMVDREMPVRQLDKGTYESLGQARNPIIPKFGSSNVTITMNPILSYITVTFTSTMAQRTDLFVL